MKKKAAFIIGIDPGVNTGLSIWSTATKELLRVETVEIHQALFYIVSFVKEFGIVKGLVHIRFEDARQRKWFGNSGREQLQGAGSIKRDCKIWEDFLTDIKVSFEMVPPKDTTTKLSSDTFKKITKWEGRTSEHSRDSAMLVFGL